MNWRDLLPGDVYVFKLKSATFKIVLSSPSKEYRVRWFALHNGKVFEDAINQVIPPIRIITNNNLRKIKNIFSLFTIGTNFCFHRRQYSITL